MSEAKRYGYLGIVEEEDGEVVKWEDYVALKADRDALAAENGLAAKAVQTFCDVVGYKTDVIAKEMGMEGAKAILAAMSATGNMPATNVYLNSVRAEGVEMFANEKLKLSELHARNRDIEMVKANNYCAMTAEEFAA